MNEPHPWHPILDGPLRERALQAVEEIAADLAAAPPATFSLARGAAGQALFFLYLHQAFPGRGHDDTAMDLLDRAIDGIGDPMVLPYLYGGFAGVAWAVEHVLWRLAPDAEDPGEEIAAALQELLRQSPWKRDYDLISGLVGYGVYALERLPRPGGRECLDLVVERLAESAERRSGRITWHTSPDLLTPEAVKMCPTGYYNLGVSHGVPGVVALLGEIEAAGLSTPTTRELLEGSLAWLLEQKLPPDASSAFSYHVAPGAEPRPARLAWCYGDLGIAAALLGVDRKEALDLGRKAAALPVEQAGIQDAGLCHGAAGVAHLFNRLYQASGQASGDPVLAQAARGWFQRTLEMRRPGEGIGGFLAWELDDRRDEMGWQRDPGFLTGAAGIGLALLSGATATIPAWDRVLLVSPA